MSVFVFEIRTAEKLEMSLHSSTHNSFCSLCLVSHLCVYCETY